MSNVQSSKSTHVEDSLGQNANPQWSNSQELRLTSSMSNEEGSALYCNEHTPLIARNGYPYVNTTHIQLTRKTDFSTTPSQCICLLLMLTVSMALLAVPLIFRFVNVKDFGEGQVNISCIKSRGLWVRGETENTNTGQCSSSVLFNGGICREELLKWQHCAFGEEHGPLYITNTSAPANPMLYSAILDLLKENATATCQSSASFFICQHLFPLCNASNEILVSKESCRSAKQSCSVELHKYSSIVSRFLPDCNLLPGNYSVLKCSDQFYVSNDVCLPHCMKFEMFPRVYIVLASVGFIFVATIGLLASIIVIITCLLRCNCNIKSLFPTLYYIYCCIGHFVLGILLMISATKGRSLFCNSENTMDSIANPSPYCKIFGACLHYILVNISYWMSCYCVFIFYKVAFPIHSKRTESKQIYVHIALSIIGWLLPLPAVVVALTNTNFQYRLFSFPPLFCITKSIDLWFYSTMVVMEVFAFINIICLIAIIWIVHKYQGILNSQSKGLLIVSAAEKKLLLVFFYYVLVGVFALIVFGLETNPQKGKMTVEVLEDYFDCMASGVDPANGTNCDKEFDMILKTNYPILLSVTLMMLAFAPVIYLVFLFNWNLLKDRVKLYFQSTSVYGQ